MRLRLFLLFLFFFQIQSCSKSTIDVVIETELGHISLELYPKQAPITVNNFLKYVDNNRYENSSFYRVTTKENEANRDYPIEVIQGGSVTKDSYFPAIEIETTEKTGIKHVNGAISMARAEVNSATSHFFICINDQPELDHAGKRNPDGYGFAAFGKVTEGMDIVKAIQSKEEEGQYLKEKVKIIQIRRK